MTKPNMTLKYPRRRLIRLITKGIFRALLNLLFRVEVEGLENFPKTGPLLIVGNHTGAMEVVLLNAYAPYQIEMLSAADMPAEKITDIINTIYGSIPVKRGSYNRAALQTALDVLGQDGMVGIFPEGGVWEVGKQRALPGVSWLSYRSGAQILPIGFNDTAGAMSGGVALKRPYLKMFVGQVMPPASIPEGVAKKDHFQDHSAQVMEQVYKLVPIADAPIQEDIANESFDFEITLTDNTGNQVKLPAYLQPQNNVELGRFFSLPHILDTFLINLELPVLPIKLLATDPPLADLTIAVKAVIDYLVDENPYMLTYRFGVPTGVAMQKGLDDLFQVLKWSSENNYRPSLRAIRRYYSVTDQKEVIQREQESALPWM